MEQSNVDVHKLDLLCEKVTPSQYESEEPQDNEYFLNYKSNCHSQVISLFTDSQNVLSKCQRLKQELGLGEEFNAKSTCL